MRDVPQAPALTIGRRDLLRLGAAGAGLLASGALSSCTGAKGGKDRSGRSAATIRYWTHDAVLSVPLLQYWAKQLSSAPGAKYNYKIEPTIIPPSDLPTKARAAFLARSKPPDLLNIEINAFSRFMPFAKDTLLDLGDAVKPVLKENLPNLTRAYSVQGRPYGVELSPALCTFYYREDQFKKLGLPRSFATWDDVLVAGKKYASPKGQYLGLVTGSGSAAGAAYPYLAFLIQRGGEIFDRDGTVVLDSPEAVEAMDFLKRAVHEGVFLAVSDTTAGPLTVALKKTQVIATWQADYFEKFVLQQLVPEQHGLWRMTPLPRFTGGGSNTSILGGASFSIAKNSPVKDAALELVKQSVLTQRGQLVKYQRVNFKPTWKSVYDDPAVLSVKDQWMGGQQIGRVYAQLAPETPLINQSPKWAAAIELISTAVKAVYQDKLSPAQAIKDASAAIRKLP